MGGNSFENIQLTRILFNLNYMYPYGSSKLIRLVKFSHVQITKPCFLHPNCWTESDLALFFFHFVCILYESTVSCVGKCPWLNQCLHMSRILLLSQIKLYIGGGAAAVCGNWRFIPAKFTFLFSFHLFHWYAKCTKIKTQWTFGLH